MFNGFVRVVTHPQAFHEPDDVEDALAFSDALRSAPHAVRVSPQERHWTIFSDLCRATRAAGNASLDAFLAAMAIERGDEWVTGDCGFARFPGLHWRDPVHER